MKRQIKFKKGRRRRTVRQKVPFVLAYATNRIIIIFVILGVSF